MSAIVYFEIFYDEGERARKFYTELFSRKVEKAPGTEYRNIATQEGTYGGMIKRFNPNQRIVDYFGVLSVMESCSRVKALSGRVLVLGWLFPKPTTMHYAWIARAIYLASGKMIQRPNAEDSMATISSARQSSHTPSPSSPSVTPSSSPAPALQAPGREQCQPAASHRAREC